MIMNKFYLSMVLIKHKFNKNYIKCPLKTKKIGFNINSMQDWYNLENKYKKFYKTKSNINSM